MRGFREIFSFTLTQQLRSKGYRGITIALALLFFLLPAVIMPCLEYFGGEDATPEPGLSGEAGTEAAAAGVPTAVYLADDSGGPAADLSFLNAVGLPGYEALRFTVCPDLDSALAQGAADPYSLAVHLTWTGDGYGLHVLLPEGSALTEDDAQSFAAVLSGSFDLVRAAKAGLALQESEALFQPTMTTIDSPAAEESLEEGDGLDGVREVLGMLLPYANIMLIYFLVLFYGQGVASCVIMEKTSKLMDTFLVSVRPRAMIFGKVFAIWLSSAIQFLLWVLSLILGFAAGSALVRLINPDTTMALLAVFAFFGSISGVFSLAGAVVAVCMVLAGFLLYCAIAAIGGALAGKPEDLASTNWLFTLVLIVSFFCTLQSGFLSGETGGGTQWMDLVPFTAILITPSRILLGNVPVYIGLLSLALVLAATALLLLFAGRLYQMMSLYKGNPPKPRQLLGMLKSK